MDRLLALLGRDRTAVYPRMLCGALFVGWLVSVALGHGWTDAVGHVVGNDFIAFHAAAVAVARDPAAPIYDLSFLAGVERELVPALGQGAPTPFLNPPPALLLYRPLAALPYGAALCVWWALGVAALVAAHAALRGSLPTLRAWSLRDLVVSALLFPPTITWFLYGQATMFVLLLLAGSTTLLVRGHEARAGVVLGLLVFKPNLAVALALPLLVAGRWRALLAGACTAGALALVATMWWPTQLAAFVAHRHTITHTVVQPGYATWGVQTLLGFWHLLVGGWSVRAADALTALSSLAVIVVCVAVWWREPWAPGTPRFRIALAATLLALYPLAGQLYLYDVALYLLPFWLVVDAIGARPRTDPALDGGPVLVGVAALWLLAFVGPYLTAAMGAGAGAVGLPRVGVQLFVPASLAAAAWLWSQRAALTVDRAPPP